MVMAGVYGFWLIVSAMFSLFVLWMFWKVVQALVGIDHTLKDIAASLRERVGEKV